MALRVLYTIFLAILLALFVGLGISAFYQAPEQPDYQSYEEMDPCKDGEETKEEKEKRQELDKQVKDYEAEMKVYNRNVSIIAMVFAVIMVVLTFIVLKNMPILNDGLLLGGVLTLAYSVIRGLGSENEQFRFIVVTVAIIVAVFLGYKKFVFTK